MGSFGVRERGTGERGERAHQGGSTRRELSRQGGPPRRETKVSGRAASGADKDGHRGG